MPERKRWRKQGSERREAGRYYASGFEGGGKATSQGMQVASRCWKSHVNFKK